jgi:hypothetical protein
MIIDLHKKDNVTNLIKDNNYWGFKKETFRDFLLKTTPFFFMVFLLNAQFGRGFAFRRIVPQLGRISLV